MQSEHPISLAHLRLSTLAELEGRPLKLAEEAAKALHRSRAYLEEALGKAEAPIYGVNTGFGALCDTVIAREERELLQYNLLRSHAAGTGDYVPAEVIRWMLMLKVQSLAQGYSGIRTEPVQRLIEHYNHDLLPVIYTHGSLGASGDLAPLAHLSLPLIGEGELWAGGAAQPAGEVLQARNWAPLQLGPKDGLALLNGTQFMTAYGLATLLHFQRLWGWALAISALSLDAFHCRTEPFAQPLQRIRQHPGQQAVAAAIRQLRQDSALAEAPASQVQDPYSFRCIPQVMGAVYDAYHYVASTVLAEINSVSDNPNLFPHQDQILAGGNFHGQSVAVVLDHLALVMAQLGAIAERRTYQLQSGQRGLPPFLARRPGLESGLMILQYTAAGLVNESKRGAHPASHDSIPSSNGQEDYVSMGANAAVKAYGQVGRLEELLAIELIHASEALRYREAEPGRQLQRELEAFRAAVPPLQGDENLHDKLAAARAFLRNRPAPVESLPAL